MEYKIKTTWDSRLVDHTPVVFSLKTSLDEPGLLIEVKAPFFNDPKNPGTPRGQAFQELYKFEVVEFFFLGDKDQYLEVQLGPHGQHLALILAGKNNIIKDMLPLSYNASISEDTWTGSAVIPWKYFPPGVRRFNATAMHGSGDQRVYEIVYPVPQGAFDLPDFHRLAYFEDIDFDSLVPQTSLDKSAHYDEDSIWKSVN